MKVPSRKSIHKNKNVRSKDVFNIDSMNQQFKRLRFGNVAKKMLIKQFSVILKIQMILIQIGIS